MNFSFCNLKLQHIFKKINIHRIISVTRELKKSKIEKKIL